MDPAARGCMHCGKHGALRARRCAASFATQLSASATVRRIVFVASTDAVYDAYRRAIISSARHDGGGRPAVIDASCLPGFNFSLHGSLFCEYERVLFFEIMGPAPAVVEDRQMQTQLAREYRVVLLINKSLHI